MKTGNIPAKSIKHNGCKTYFAIGGSTPPQSRVRLLPQHMNKPLLWRIKEWWS